MLQWSKNKALYGLLFISLVIAVSYWPYIYYDFGFHNDFTVWEYDNKSCCSSFVETQHLINIGRFLQAFLQNIFLMYFYSVESFAHGRFLSILTAIVCSYMLVRLSKKHGLSSSAAYVLGIGTFLLPPAQVNLGWIANYIPGVFNALIAICAISIMPNTKTIFQNKKNSVSRLLLTIFLLISCMYIYPPTAGFFLLPALIKAVSEKYDKLRDYLEIFIYQGIFCFCCLIYFVSHKLFSSFNNISFPHGSLYQFEVARDLIPNLAKFVTKVLPVFLNLFIPTSNIFIAGLVLIFFALLRFNGIFRFALVARNDKNIWLNIYVRSLIMCLTFLLINAPGLLAAGSPPLFYRAWHPGMTAILLFLIMSIDLIKIHFIKRCLFVLLVAFGIVVSFESSFHLANTLSEQYIHARNQFKAQFNVERENYLIVENRPKSFGLDINRWGELGFIHILSRGHGIYILSRHLDHNIHPIIETVVADEEKNELIIEANLIGLSPQKLMTPPQILENQIAVALFDSRIDTDLDLRLKEYSVQFEVSKPSIIGCYKIYPSLTGDKSSRPSEWRLFGSVNKLNWKLLDERNNFFQWQNENGQSFVIAGQSEKYKFFRLDFDGHEEQGVKLLSELELFRVGNVCDGFDLKPNINMQDVLEDSIASISSRQSHDIFGIVSESSVSNPSFRIQRAFDDIYYTFWETVMESPVYVDLSLEKPQMLTCYSLHSGEDKAHQRMPRKWKLLGFTDKVGWKTIDTQVNQRRWRDNEKRTYKISVPEIFDRYKLSIEEVDGDQFLRLYEIKFSTDPMCKKFIP